MTRGRILFPAFTLLLLAADMVMQVRAGNAGDKDWLLLATRMWLLDGRTLYHGVFEVNPPLILWIYAIPVFVAQHLHGVYDYEVLALMGIASAALSTAIATYFIGRHPAFEENGARRLDYAILLAYTLIFFTSDVYFFDRDHLMFVFLFPYLMRFMPGIAFARIPLPLRLLIGLLAAVALCVKPHALLVFIAVQLFRLRHAHLRDVIACPENLPVYIGGPLYICCVWYFAPDYIHVVLPMAAAAYSGFNRRMNAVIFLTVAAVSAGLTFVDFRRRFVTPYRRDVYYLITVCLGFLAYSFAGNGWGYTYNPLLCTLLFLCGWVLLEYRWLKNDAVAQGRSAKPFLFGIRACMANLGINVAYSTLYIALFFFNPSCGKEDCSGYGPYISYMKDHNVRSFGVFSMNFRRWTELTRMTGARWETRFNHLWMLPKFLQSDAEFSLKNKWIIDYVSRAFAEDMDKRKPDIIFVDHNDKIFGYPHPVNMPAFFAGTSEFKEAWGHYVYDYMIDQCEDDSKTLDSNNKKDEVPKKNTMDCRYDVFRRAR